MNAPRTHAMQFSTAWKRIDSLHKLRFIRFYCHHLLSQNRSIELPYGALPQGQWLALAQWTMDVIWATICEMQSRKWFSNKVWLYKLSPKSMVDRRSRLHKYFSGCHRWNGIDDYRFHFSLSNRNRIWGAALIQTKSNDWAICSLALGTALGCVLMVTPNITSWASLRRRVLHHLHDTSNSSSTSLRGLQILFRDVFLRDVRQQSPSQLQIDFFLFIFVPAISVNLDHDPGRIFYSPHAQRQCHVQPISLSFYSKWVFSWRLLHFDCIWLDFVFCSEVLGNLKKEEKTISSEEQPVT